MKNVILATLFMFAAPLKAHATICVADVSIGNAPLSHLFCTADPNIPVVAIWAEALTAEECESVLRKIIKHRLDIVNSSEQDCANYEGHFGGDDFSGRVFGYCS